MATCNGKSVRCIQRLIHRLQYFRQISHSSVNYAVNVEKETPETSLLQDDEFRTLDIKRIKAQRPVRRKRQFDTQMMPPRYTKMPVDQDWKSVWPTARSFNPSSNPLPVRQGYNPKGAPVGRFGNLELMKIPNFFHLTPPAIKAHCAAIKQFCTPWPKGLETDELCEKHFPITVISDDYCHSGPTIRDVKARIVTLQVRLSKLQLDYHAKDKLLRLVGERYNPETDILTIVVERCPLKKQNYDYAYYLLTALYHESWKIEPWESEKTESDMEKYVWGQSKSKGSLTTLIEKLKEAEEKETLERCESFQWMDSLPKDPQVDVSEVEVVNTYAETVTKMHNVGEDEAVLEQYKKAVKNILGLSS